MKLLVSSFFLLGLTNFGESYSKYGRSCSDIGCSRNERCVMKEDPCDIYRRSECGKYPTCERIGGASKDTCVGYQCPPTTVCKMEGGHPKCISDSSKMAAPSYDTKAISGDRDDHRPSAPLPPNTGHQGYPGGGSVYPGTGGNVYPSGGNRYPAGGSQYPGGGSHYPAGGAQYPGYPSGGYAGGRVGSGYPGQPQQPAGYPAGGYSGQGQYGNTGYNSRGGAGYYGNSPGTYQNSYGSSSYGYGYGHSGSSSTSDSFSDSLKQFGLFCCLLKYLIYKLIDV